MIARALLLISLCLAAATPAAAQCFIDTPAQRATWDRMKAENSDGYKQILFNTTWDRYADEGRWELVAGTINRDAALMQKAYEEIKKNLQGFSLIYRGNESREMTIEHAMIYACLKPYLTAEQEALYRGWLVKVADGIVAALRIGDSDQDAGNYFGLAAIDKVIGTRYLDGKFIDPNISGVPNTPVGGLTPTDCKMATSLRDAVCHFAKTMGKGGVWPEGGEYNLGTTGLVLMGASWVGMQYFPEVRQFALDYARELMHEQTPGLKDTWQYGDDEHPHELPIGIYLSPLLVQVARTIEVDAPPLAAALRQYERDIAAANGYVTNPLFARYYYWVDPYAPVQDWRPIAGNVSIATGQGHVKWRTGTTLADKGTHTYFPQFTNGAVDHFQAFTFGDLRVFNHGRFVLDRPIGYALDQRFGNHLMIANVGPSLEATGLTGTAFKDKQYGYAVGTTAGMSSLFWDGAYANVPTFLHEHTRHTFEPIDGADTVVLVIDRVKAENPKTQTLTNQWGTFGFDQLYPYQTQRDIINAAVGLKDAIWHAPVRPTIGAAGVSWPTGDVTVRVDAIAPTPTLAYTVVDEQASLCDPTGAVVKPGCLGGYINASELKFAVHAVPTVEREWDVFVECLTAAPTAAAARPTCAAVPGQSGEPIVGARIDRPGRAPATFIASAKEGPRLSTTYAANGVNMKFDAGKLEIVTKARMFAQGFTVTVPAGPVYVADLPEALTWRVTQAGSPLVFARHGALMVGTAAAGVLTVQAVGAAPIPDPPPVVDPPPPPPPPPPAPCVYSTSALTSVSADAGSTAIPLAASAPSCVPASVSSSAPWVTVAIAGTSIAATYQANATTIARTATIAFPFGLVSKAVQLTQAGRVAPPPPPPPTPACAPFKVITMSATASLATWQAALNAAALDGYTTVAAIYGSKAVLVKDCR